MRPIDAYGLMGKLYAKASEWRGTFSGVAYTHACEMIEKEPTLDMVEVVRCKDCKYYETAHSSLLGEIPICAGQGDMYIEKKPTDFCSCGEWRTNGRTDI